MSPFKKTFGIVMSIGIVSAHCQTVSAEVVPPHPGYSWLFDEGSGDTSAPHAGGNDAVLEDEESWS